MMTREVPDTLVTQTKKVMAKDGAWNRLTLAVNALTATVIELGYSQDYATLWKALHNPFDQTRDELLKKGIPDSTYRLRPQRAGLSETDALSLLIGDYGFKAEWGNGAATLSSISAESKMNHQEVLDDFEKPSQLIKFGKGAMIGIERETVREALQRLPVEMELLLACNTDRISEADKLRAEGHVAEYRAALVQVLEYADLVKDQLGRPR